METGRSIMEHVLYEIWMYLATFNYMHKYSQCDTTEQVIVHNAMWESHLVHLRAMLFFFDQPRGNRDRRNIYIDNIVQNPEGCYFTEPNDKTKSVISQTIAHLSSSRIDVNKADLAEEIAAQMKKTKPLIYHFLVNIDVNIKEEFKEDLIENRGMLQEIVHELKG